MNIKIYREKPAHSSSSPRTNVTPASPNPWVRVSGNTTEKQKYYSRSQTPYRKVNISNGYASDSSTAVPAPINSNTNPTYNMGNGYSTPASNGYLRKSMDLKSSTLVIPISPNSSDSGYSRSTASVISPTYPTTNKPATNGKYSFTKQIGRGNFATVKLAVHELTGCEVAIKSVAHSKLNTATRQKLKREIRILQRLEHPNIIRLYEVVNAPRHTFLVCEYCSNGDVHERLLNGSPVPESTIRPIMRQLFSAIEYCHRRGIVHRDLKPENLLLDQDNSLKLADFGFVTEFYANSYLDTFCGSPPFAAPELLKGEKYHGPEVDIWAIGVIIYLLVCGKLPFDGKNVKELQERVMRNNYDIPYVMTMTCEKLLKKILVTAPSERATIYDIIKHEWTNIGSEILQPYHGQPETFDDAYRITLLMALGFDAEAITDSLQKHEFNNIMSTYLLLGGQQVRSRVASRVHQKQYSGNTSIDQLNIASLTTIDSGAGSQVNLSDLEDKNLNTENQRFKKTWHNYGQQDSGLGSDSIADRERGVTMTEPLPRRLFNAPDREVDPAAPSGEYTYDYGSRSGSKVVIDTKDQGKPPVEDPTRPARRRRFRAEPSRYITQTVKQVPDMVTRPSTRFEQYQPDQLAVPAVHRTVVVPMRTHGYRQPEQRFRMTDVRKLVATENVPPTTQRIEIQRPKPPIEIQTDALLTNSRFRKPSAFGERINYAMNELYKDNNNGSDYKSRKVMVLLSPQSAHRQQNKTETGISRSLLSPSPNLDSDYRQVYIRPTMRHDDPNRLGRELVNIFKDIGIDFQKRENERRFRCTAKSSTNSTTRILAGQQQHISDYVTWDVLIEMGSTGSYELAFTYGSGSRNLFNRIEQQIRNAVQNRFD